MLFRSDGDKAPIKAIANLCQKHNAWLAVDDAHGLGIIGETGKGVVEYSGLTPEQLPIIIGTFGKAVGTSGAYIAASQLVIDYIKNFARHYIYSTAMSPINAAATTAKLQQMMQEQWRRETLQRNIVLFRRAAREIGLPVCDSETPIQPVIVGTPSAALSMANALKQQGIWALPIRTPTVPINTDRIRITLTALHTEQDISDLINGLAHAKSVAENSIKSTKSVKPKNKLDCKE